MRQNERKLGLWLVWCCLLVVRSAVSIAQELPVFNLAVQQNVTADWLVKPVIAKAQVFKSADGKDLIL